MNETPPSRLPHDYGDETGINRPAVILRYAAVAIVFYTLALWLGYVCIPSWYALPTAGAPLIIALVLHNNRAAGFWRYRLSVPLNATSTGLAASAYFRALSLPLQSNDLLLAAILLFLLLIPAYLLANRFETKKQQMAIGLTSLILFLGALTALIILWCTHPREETRYAMLTFHLIFFSFYYLAFFIATSDEENEAQRLISFWSFSLALTVAAIAGIALLIAAGGDGCDCDCGDGCDCLPDSNRKKKRK